MPPTLARRTSLHGSVEMAPVASVTRSSVASWKATRRPSAVVWTSVSK